MFKYFVVSHQLMSLFADAGETSPRDVDVLPLHDAAAQIQIAAGAQLEIRIARR